MKNLILFILYSVCSLNISFSQIDSLKINFNEEKVLLFGETHNVLENYEIKKKLITRLIAEYEGKVNVLFEYPVSLEYFINKLNNYGDSTGIVNYFNNIYNEKSEPSNYFLFIKEFIYTLCNNNYNKKFEFHCVDIEKHLRALLFSCHNILYKYNQNDCINKHFLFLDSLLCKHKLANTDFIVYENRFRKPLIENKEFFKKIILDSSDYYYFFEIIKHPIQINDFDKRENIIFENCIEVLKNNYLSIGFFGSAHINKFYSDSIKSINVNKSLGFLLNTRNESFVKNKVKSILIINYKYNNTIRKLFTIFNKEEMAFFSNLCKSKNSIIINPNYYNFSFATKAYDFIIFIDNATKIETYY